MSMPKCLRCDRPGFRAVAAPSGEGLDYYCRVHYPAGAAAIAPRGEKRRARAKALAEMAAAEAAEAVACTCYGRGQCAACTLAAYARNGRMPETAIVRSLRGAGLTR